MARIFVFAGSSAGLDPRFAAGARAFDTALAARGHGLVYGGGRLGLMGAVAQAVLEGGGEVLGVIPRFMVAREVAHEGLTRLENFRPSSMHSKWV